MKQFSNWAGRKGLEHFRGPVALMFYGGLRFSQMLRLSVTDLQRRGTDDYSYEVWLRADKRRSEAQRNMQNGHFTAVNVKFAKWFAYLKRQTAGPLLLGDVAIDNKELNKAISEAASELSWSLGLTWSSHSCRHGAMNDLRNEIGNLVAKETAQCSSRNFAYYSRRNEERRSKD